MGGEQCSTGPAVIRKINQQKNNNKKKHVNSKREIVEFANSVDPDEVAHNEPLFAFHTLNSQYDTAQT